MVSIGEGKSVLKTMVMASHRVEGSTKLEDEECEHCWWKTKTVLMSLEDEEPDQERRIFQFVPLSGIQEREKRIYCSARQLGAKDGCYYFHQHSSGMLETASSSVGLNGAYGVLSGRK